MPPIPRKPAGNIPGAKVAKTLERNESLSRKGFEAGELTLSDYLLARNTALDAAGQLIDARAAAVTARAALVAVTGGP